MSAAVRTCFDKPFTLKNQFKAELHLARRSDSPVGKRVLVMRPKLGLATTPPGWPKLAWLKRSKIPARNWARILSPNAAFFTIEKSVLLNPGPTTTFLPRLPKPETGVNTEVSNQRSGEPIIGIGPVTSGRSVFATPVTVLLVVTILTGLPLCACTIAATCQPSRDRLRRKGSS